MKVVDQAKCSLSPDQARQVIGSTSSHDGATTVLPAPRRLIRKELVFLERYGPTIR
jgi:hypothetical protein